jgi:hypothetical protein
MDSRLVEATRAIAPGASDEAVLRAACQAFLAFMASEPEFAKIFYIDMPGGGPQAVDQLARAQYRYADLNQAWHERARRRHPDWPVLPDDAYLGLAGATFELVKARVRSGQTSSVPELEDTMVALHLAVMAGQPWPARGAGHSDH